MKRLLIGLVVLMLAAGVANATRPTVETSAIDRDDVLSPNRVNVVFWFDDMESGAEGWISEGRVRVNGQQMEGNIVPVLASGKTHHVQVIMGS